MGKAQHNKTAPGPGFDRAAAFCGLGALCYLVASLLLNRLAGALLALGVPGASLANPAGISQAQAALLRLAVNGLALAAPFLLVGLQPLRPGRMALRRPRPGLGKGLFLLFWLAMMAGNGAANLLGRALGRVESRVEVPADPGLLFLVWLAVGLVPAVGEELLFRGLLQGWLRPYGSWLSIVGQAVLFALLHGSGPACLSALFGGLALGLCAEYSGSILWGMAFHLYNNTMALAAQYEVQYGSGLFVQLALQFGLPLVVFCLWLAEAGRPGGRKRPRLRPGLPVSALLKSPGWAASGVLLLANVIFTTLR